MPANVRLPNGPTPFVGRAREVDAVAALLADPDIRCVTLVGPAGVGKTRLGVEAARRVARTYPGGVTFVALAEVQDPAMLPAVVLEADNTGDVGARPALSVLVDRLGDRAILLVLDNLEQIVSSVP